MIHTAIIGCGSIAKVHAESIRALEGVTLSAVADCRSERAEALAREYGSGDVRVCSSLEELLEEHKPDVLHICTPHNCHVPMAVQALAHGVHVFMEKPPAINRTQYHQLQEAVSGCGSSLGICFQNRYNETTKTVDRLLQEPETGALLGARAFVTWNRPAPYYTESQWRGRLESEGGGALINQAIHTLDLLIHWLGNPICVEASMANHHLKGVVEVEDTLEAFLAFDGGTSPFSPNACFYATTAYAADAPVLIELACEHASIRLEGNQVQCRYHDGQTVTYDHSAGPASGKAYWGNGHLACIADYYHSLGHGLPYANDLASADVTFDAMMKIYESARQAEKTERN